MHKTTGLRAITFFFTAFVIFAAANLGVYFALARVFQLSGKGALVLGLAVVVLSGGFIATLIAEKYTAHILVQRLYLLTSIWMGAFGYFFFAAVLYGFISIFTPDARVFGLALFGMAFLVSAYGVVHGQHAQVKKITVTLPGLPESWRGKTAVWVSDLHLGSIQGRRFAARVTRMVNALSPNVVFIGGDLYDGTHAPDPHVLAEPLRALVATNGVYYVTGNHEEFGDPSSFLEAIRTLGIRILDNEIVDIDGLQLLGVDYAGSVRKENFTKVLASLSVDRARASILLKHEPRDLDVATEAGITLSLHGHTHKGQQWPFNYLANSVYKGYGYGLKLFGSMFVHTSSGVGTWGPPLRVGSDGEIVHISFT
jgi:predicted MPP superfamily phosphohydrolase